MTTQLEQAARLALEALEKSYKINGYPENKKAINALRAALEQPAQDCQHCGGTGDVSGEYPGVACPECTGTGVKTKPEFIKHEVENAEDWSEWVCPDPKGYLMECCDCGLVHEAEFMVVRYKSETEREVCEPVDDPNLQAVFRMRRSEQWSPVDTAHRAGGLPMEQPAQDEPVALETVYETIIQWTKVAANAVGVNWHAALLPFTPDLSNQRRMSRWRTKSQESSETFVRFAEAQTSRRVILSTPAPKRVSHNHVPTSSAPEKGHITARCHSMSR